MANLSPLPYKGTRDYYPADKQRQNYIFSVWRDVVESFGYIEYGTPLLESIDIYAAKSGQELVNDQTYTFTDKGGRIVAIRPEMTPSISRLVAAKRQELAYPARLYSIANFMRYERPQRGREREFWQLNVDVFGIDHIEADTEIILIADTILKRFGATGADYVIRLNNRKLINFMTVKYLGLDEVQSIQVVKLLDRKAKITDQDFTDQAQQIFFGNQESVDKLIALTQARSIDDLPDILKESEGATELQSVMTQLVAAGVTGAVFDMALMRGLDYYSGVVFEVFDTHPDNNRSLFGGGRYDGLVGLFGAEPISAVGVAPGSSMIENFLAVHNLFPDQTSGVTAYVIPIGNNVAGAQLLAGKLRDRSMNVEVDYTRRKLDRQLKTAEKKLIPFVVFVGENELHSGQYSVKELLTGIEESLTLDAVVQKLKS